MTTAGATARAPRCGACTLCCTVMRVGTMDPPKVAHKTCLHCTPSGCSIYADRPDACSGFQCLWLASQRMPEMAMPAAMRPDRVGVVIDLNPAGAMIAHCERPGSWRREPMRSWLLRYARKANVMLETSIGAELLLQDGSTDKLVKIGVDPSGYRLYARASELDRVQHGASA